VEKARLRAFSFCPARSREMQTMIAEASLAALYGLRDRRAAPDAMVRSQAEGVLRENAFSNVVEVEGGSHADPGLLHWWAVDHRRGGL
jgi:hypothetical protein